MQYFFNCLFKQHPEVAHGLDVVRGSPDSLNVCIMRQLGVVVVPLYGLLVHGRETVPIAFC